MDRRGNQRITERITKQSISSLDKLQRSTSQMGKFVTIHSTSLFFMTVLEERHYSKKVIRICVTLRGSSYIKLSWCAVAANCCNLVWRSRVGESQGREVCSVRRYLLKSWDSTLPFGRFIIFSDTISADLSLT